MTVTEPEVGRQLRALAQDCSDLLVELQFTAWTGGPRREGLTASLRVTAQRLVITSNRLDPPPTIYGQPLGPGFLRRSVLVALAYAAGVAAVLLAGGEPRSLPLQVAALVTGALLAQLASAGLIRISRRGKAPSRQDETPAVRAARLHGRLQALLERMREREVLAEEVAILEIADRWLAPEVHHD